MSGALSGEALGWVTWKDIVIMASLYAVVGAFLFFGRRKLQLCSEDPKQARQMGISVKKWDFLFYASFGLVVTSSVKVSGVLAVFSYLIVPVVFLSDRKVVVRNMVALSNRLQVCMIAEDTRDFHRQFTTVPTPEQVRKTMVEL